jgi:hypothetical protein
MTAALFVCGSKQTGPLEKCRFNQLEKRESQNSHPPHVDNQCSDQPRRGPKAMKEGNRVSWQVLMLEPEQMAAISPAMPGESAALKSIK